MINPAFFAYDNFNTYGDGPLATPRASLGWVAAGTTIQYLLTWSRDNFDSNLDGTLDSPAGGTDWAEPAQTNYYSN